MMNGIITPSIGSSTLTLALKTWAGNDPSTTDPVYFVIDGVLRSITAALSITMNKTTLTFLSGSAELTGREIDYFVYLSWNTIDGGILAFSRIPYAKVFSDFSATVDDEKYVRVSGTNSISTSSFINIGRFSAIYNGAAVYTWQAPGGGFQVINKPTYETKILTWAPTVTGFSGTPTATATYKLVNTQLWFTISITGTSNAGTLTWTAPFKSVETKYGFFFGKDNSAFLSYPCIIYATAASNVINAIKDGAGNAWTSSNIKEVEPTQFCMFVV